MLEVRKVWLFFTANESHCGERQFRKAKVLGEIWEPKWTPKYFRELGESDRRTLPGL